MALSIDSSSEFWKTKNSDNLNSYFIRNVCRLCANISDNVLPIFDETNEKGSVHMKLKKCLPSILVSESDLKPKQICVACTTKLDECVSFVEMSRNADSKFEALLQNKDFPQIEIGNDSLSSDRFAPSHQDSSWLHIKQALEWPEVKHDSSTEQKLSSSSIPGLLTQLCQQKAFQQQISIPNRCHSHPQENSVVPADREDINHTLQSLVVQDEVSSQDIIVLLELKCKDSLTVNNAPVGHKKADLPPDSVKIESLESNLQTRIMDTNGNIRVINISDFDGKFIQAEKVTSPFVIDSAGGKTTNCMTPKTTSPPKALETDLLNAFKLDSFIDLDTEPLNVSSKPVQKCVVAPGMPLLSVVHLSNAATTAGQHSREVSQQPRDFRCITCGKQFTRRNRLNAHLARHSSERPHSCDKCDQRFITRWDLTLHLRIHSGEFSCEFCGKAFPARGKLDRHRRTHTGERPFPCTVCNRAFSEKRNLRNHLNTHVPCDAKKAANASKSYSNLWHATGTNGSESGNTTTSDSSDRNGSLVDPDSNGIQSLVNITAKREMLIDRSTNKDSDNNTVDLMSNDMAAFLKT